MKSINLNDSGKEYIKKVDDVYKVESRERILQEFIIGPFIQSLLPDKDVVPVDTKVSGKIHNYELYCGKYGYTKNNKTIITTETPDLCISNDWIWLNDGKSRKDYIATVEIKTVYSNNEYWISPGYINNYICFENEIENVIQFINDNMLKKDCHGDFIYVNDDEIEKSLSKQIGIHLRGIDKVIATDAVRWVFFYKDANGCRSLPPIDLGKRNCKKSRKYYKHESIEWFTQDVIMKGRKLETLLKNYELLKYVIQEFCNRDISEMNELTNIINRRIEK